MSKQITMTAYEFDELSDKAKEKAREWWRNASAGDSDWSEYTIEEAVREAALMGIDITNKQDGRGDRIYWSGFWSQGDGACFEGTWRASGVKADKVADGWGEDPATTEIKRIAAVFGKIAKSFPCSSFSVVHRGHYSHEHCTEFSFESGADYCDPDQLDRYRTPEDDPQDPNTLPRDRMAEDFPEDDLKEAAKDFMRWIYRQLEKEYEYQNSDEQVDETLRANDYLFSEEGKRTMVL